MGTTNIALTMRQARAKEGSELTIKSCMAEPVRDLGNKESSDTEAHLSQALDKGQQSRLSCCCGPAGRQAGWAEEEEDTRGGKTEV